MIRTACLAATLLAGAFLPIASASGAITINGKVSQVVNALRNGSQFSHGDLTFAIKRPGGSKTLFRGIAGVRGFYDLDLLNDWVDEQPVPSVFDGGPYKFTHSVLDSYFTELPKASSPFDGGPYKFTHTVLGSYFGEIPTDSSQQYRLSAGPLEPVTVRTFDQPVPEPASWAMMIGGFALVGAMMRRRAMAIHAA